MPDAVETITVDKVARRLGIEPNTLTEMQRERIEDALTDARTKAREEIGRDLEPRSVTLSPCWPDSRYPLTDWRAWPVDHLDDDVRVVSYEAMPEDYGYFTVHLSVGLDATREAPIQRFILADAVESLRNDPTAGVGERAVKSVSAEGQSITWVDQPKDAAATGSGPSVAWLRKYKRKVWMQTSNASETPWPYSSPVRW